MFRAANINRIPRNLLWTHACGRSGDLSSQWSSSFGRFHTSKKIAYTLKHGFTTQLRITVGPHCSRENPVSSAPAKPRVSHRFQTKEAFWGTLRLEAAQTAPDATVHRGNHRPLCRPGPVVTLLAVAEQDLRIRALYSQRCA